MLASEPDSPEELRESTAQKQEVRRMFDAVAPRYDFLNHLLSAGVDLKWRKRAVRELGLRPGDRLLDLCAGTGDLGFEAMKQVPGVSVIGVDLSRPMLTLGVGKSRSSDCLFLQGDAEQLPLPDGSLDAAAVGFGIRNVSNLERALKEAARVLRPKGRFAVLEFTRPPNPIFRKLYEIYFHRVLPRIGGALSGHPEAYTYLPESVKRFPSPEELAGAMETAGFSRAEWSLLSGGIAALHLGHR